MKTPAGPSDGAEKMPAESPAPKTVEAASEGPSVTETPPAQPSDADDEDLPGFLKEQLERRADVVETPPEEQQEDSSVA